MKGLFLDDERFEKEVTWVKYPEGMTWQRFRCPHAFIEYFEELIVVDEESFPFPDVISFDHDLQSFKMVDGKKVETTGYDALKKFLEYMESNRHRKLPKIYFHTMNPEGKRNMESYYFNWRSNVWEPK